MRPPLALLGLLVAGACSSPEPPPDEPLDANVLIGDSAPRDASRADGATGRDAAAPDADATTVDAGTRDADLDAGAADAPDAGTACAHAPELTLTATGAAARAEELAGRFVEVVGLLAPSPPACQPATCPPEEPCCGTCTSSLAVGGEVWLLPTTCHPFAGCSGNRCTATCQPAVLGAPQSFRGLLGRRPNGIPTLELESVGP